MKARFFYILFGVLIAIGWVALLGAAIGYIWVPPHSPANHVLGEVAATASITLLVGIAGDCITAMVSL